MLAALGSPWEQPVSESDAAPGARRGRKRRHDDSDAALASDDGGAAVSPTKRQRGGGGGGGEGVRRAEKDAAATLPDGPPATTADEPMSAAQVQIALNHIDACGWLPSQMPVWLASSWRHSSTQSRVTLTMRVATA